MAKTIRKRKGSQKMYMMKGCSKRRPKSVRRPKGSRRPKSVRRQSIGRGRSIGLAGGNCTTCLQGGSTTSPLVGAPWSATDGQAQAPSNHYAQNMYTQDPQMMMQVRGGKGSRGKRRGRKGSRGKRRIGRRKGLKGGFGITDVVPGDVLSLTRDLSFNASSAYSSLTGATQPVNPSVTHQNLQSQVNLNRIIV